MSVGPSVSGALCFLGDTVDCHFLLIHIRISPLGALLAPVTTLPSPLSRKLVYSMLELSSSLDFVGSGPGSSS